ncbi:MFS transporter [Kitasatospora phosalacinea]|uniref:MFS transporter n=1 Tax=Kitasatospora phosalacinea TaxID=2065 RepID=UPI000524D5B6|nr:MFS transporter [Kitasatospora phosalacinea]
MPGRLHDLPRRLDRQRRPVHLGLVLFALASLAAGLGQDAWQLIAPRGAQGLGAAFIATAALALLGGNFAEGAERNKALGAWGRGPGWPRWSG